MLLGWKLEAMQTLESWCYECLDLNLNGTKNDNWIEVWLVMLAM